MDAVTAFTVFLSDQFSSKISSKTSYIEDFGSLVISGTLCAGAFRALWQSWGELSTSLPGFGLQLPGVWALWIPLLIIITKETINGHPDYIQSHEYNTGAPG